MRRLRLIGSSLLLLLCLASAAHADRRVVWVGESSPWVELLRAELSMIDVSVDPAYAAPPQNEAEVRERLDEWDALGIVVSDEPAVLWLPACNGRLHATRVPTVPSPGASTVLIAELLWAHLNEECPQLTPMTHPLPAALPTAPPVRLADTSSVAALSAPASSAVVHAEPLLARAEATPVRPGELSAPTPPLSEERSSEATSSEATSSEATSSEATSSEATSNRRRMRWELHIDALTGRDDMALTPRLAAGLGAAVQFHSHLALVAHGTAGSGRNTDAPFVRASTLLAGFGLRASTRIGSWRLSAEAGPSVLWVRAAFEPNLGYNPQSAVFAGYHFGAAIEVPLVGRFRLRVLSRMTQSGRRRDLTLGHRELGRWGPIFQGGLGLAATL